MRAAQQTAVTTGRLRGLCVCMWPAPCSGAAYVAAKEIGGTQHAIPRTAAVANAARASCFPVSTSGRLFSFLFLGIPLRNPCSHGTPVPPSNPQGLIRFWPWSCSSKQVLFLNELEDVLELLMDEQVRLSRLSCCSFPRRLLVWRPIPHLKLT